MSKSAAVALLEAALQAHREEEDRVRAAFLASAARGRPKVDGRVGHAVELGCRGQAYRLIVRQLERDRFRIEVDGTRIDLRTEGQPGGARRLSCLGGDYGVASRPEGAHLVVVVEGTEHRISREDVGIVRAPAPAVVVALRVGAGDEVAEGDPLAVVEAMKMEMTVTAPFPGRVRRLFAAVNQQVDQGQALLQVVAPRGEDGSSDEERIVFDGTDRRTIDVPMCEITLAGLQQLLLGFDVEASEAARLAGRWAAACTEKPELRRREDELLRIFADVAALFAGGVRRTPGPEGDLVADRPRDDLSIFVRTLDARHRSLDPAFVETLRRAVAHHGVHDLARSRELEEAVFRLYRSTRRVREQAPAIAAILDRRLDGLLEETPRDGERDLLDRIVEATRSSFPQIADLATEVRYRLFDQPLFERIRDEVYAKADADLRALAADPQGSDAPAHLDALVRCPQPLERVLIERLAEADARSREAMVQVLARRLYRIRDLQDVVTDTQDTRAVVSAGYDHEGTRVHLLATHGELGEFSEVVDLLASRARKVPPGEDVAIDCYLRRAATGPETGPDADRTSEDLRSTLDQVSFGRPIRRLVVAIGGAGPVAKLAPSEHYTFRQGPEGFWEEKRYRGLHPMMGKRLELWRMDNFDADRLPSVEDVYLFHAAARENPKDERLFAIAEVRDLTPVRGDRGRVVALPHLERMLTEAFEAIRDHQAHRQKRLQWNRVTLHVWPQADFRIGELFGIIQRLAPSAEGLGLEKVVVLAQFRNPDSGEFEDRVLHLSNPLGRGLSVRFDARSDRPIEPLTEYMQKVVLMRQRGLTYPYEIVRMLTLTRGTPSDFPPGEFVEYDLDGTGESLVPVDRSFGRNVANVVTGVISSFTDAHPDGMRRVILLGDPSHALGSLAEPECRRIMAALDLAERLHVPLEWFALSAGAKIAMDSGVENMDWIARVLRRLIEFTQGGGEVNVVVCGINVGAQPYWNAEATMLMHTKGILVMTPESAMVLTGKQALDYSGGVSAEDNFGIGGYDRVMGPNGQAQYWARDLTEACQVLLRHYGFTYVAPGERFPRRTPTTDPAERDVRGFPHRAERPGDFLSVGDVFSEASNPSRKHGFDIRSVMRAASDQDVPPLERWSGMRDAETVVVWDARLGGIPVCMLGIESKPVARRGFVPADGPDEWTSGTLFPLSSKKAARAVNAASGNRPLVVLANLSGFDGSPESLRNWQLEYGAEIGRAVVNFRGPIVFCVVSRYHGGAFVVFSATLNDHMEVAAVEGSFASVIGGAPAAAVVFTREVNTRTNADPRLVELEAGLAAASDATEKARLRKELDRLMPVVRTEKLGEVAEEFDRIHSIQRAQAMGAVHHVVPAEMLRPYLIGAVERGIRRELAEPVVAASPP